MRIALLCAMLWMAAGYADAQFRDIPIHRSVTQGGVKVTLQRIVVSGSRGRQNVQAVCLVTDPKGRPLTTVQGVRLTLTEAGKSSAITLGSSGALYVTVTGLNEAALQRVHTLTLSLRAAQVAPTRVWANVAVQSHRAGLLSAPPYRDRDVEAQVTGVYRGTESALLGYRTLPTVTVEMAERALRGRLPGSGLIRVEAPGAKPVEDRAVGQGQTNTYQATLVFSAGGRAPGRVTIRYFSAPTLARALKPYRFTFSGIRLTAL